MINLKRLADLKKFPDTTAKIINCFSTAWKRAKVASVSQSTSVTRASRETSCALASSNANAHLDQHRK